MHDQFSIVSRVKAVKVFKGIDNRGCESIVFILRGEPIFELKTSKISSKIVEISSHFYLYISLEENDDTSKEIFEVLVEDLLGSVEIATTETEVFEILSRRFQYWTDLFKINRERIDEKWIRGFVGELWFLRNVLFEKVGIENAIKSWTGPERANQDFILEDKIFEIKTKSEQSNSVKISNDNQLQRGMYLVIIELSRSSDVSNTSVNLTRLITGIRNKISSPEVNIFFNMKLLQLGLYPDNNVTIYNEFSYDIRSINYFPITSEFPIIDHSQVPKAIVKYSYDVSITSIDEFIVREESVWR